MMLMSSVTTVKKEKEKEEIRTNKTDHPINTIPKTNMDNK